MDSKRIVLIPAYKPDSKMLDLLDQLSNLDFTIIVVNDGSGSAFDSIFEEAEDIATVITHCENKGKGEALKTGIAYISNHFSEPYVIVTADADGQHRVKDIIRVSVEATDHPDSLILGSRKLNKNVPLRSRFGNAVTRSVYHLASKTKVYDTQTGLRAFSNKLVPLMKSVKGSRYEYEMNVLMRVAENNIPIKELWIDTVYIDNNSSSHFNTIKDSYRIYKEILGFSLSSFLSFLVDYTLFCLISIKSGITIANVSARIISGSVNYTVNKKYVFNSNNHITKSLPQYILLAIFILICNTIILRFFVHAGINRYIAKIVTEIILFVFSYFMQHHIIFKKEGVTL